MTYIITNNIKDTPVYFINVHTPNWAWCVGILDFEYAYNTRSHHILYLKGGTPL